MCIYFRYTDPLHIRGQMRPFFSTISTLSNFKSKQVVCTMIIARGHLTSSKPIVMSNIKKLIIFYESM